MSASYLLQNDNNPSVNLDRDNRDPQQINKHLQLDFFNVIAEPDSSAYNFEAVHRASHQIYHYSKVFIYRLLTVLVGIPLMLFWGLSFGIYTFTMIWVAAPIRRIMQSVIVEAGIYIQTISDAALGPFFRSMGQIFSAVRVSIFNQQIEAQKTVQV